MWLPPPETKTSPAELFRFLLPRRPLAHLSFRFSALPDAQLWVQAIRSLEANQANDEAQRLQPESRQQRIMASLTATSLIDSQSRRVFRSADDVDALPAHEAEALCRAAWEALSVVSPVWRWANHGAWHTALCRGAKDPSNAVPAYLLGQCYDGGGYSRLVERPERYWACPQYELTDGQLMAYRAARTVFEESLPKG